MPRLDSHPDGWLGHHPQRLPRLSGRMCWQASSWATMVPEMQGTWSMHDAATVVLSGNYLSVGDGPSEPHPTREVSACAC